MEFESLLQGEEFLRCFYGAAGAPVKEESRYSRSKETFGTGAKTVALPGGVAWGGGCLGCGGN